MVQKKKLIVKSDPSDPANSGGGYLLIGWDQFDGNGFDIRMFGSAPFKPKFKTFWLVRKIPHYYKIAIWSMTLELWFKSWMFL